MSTGYPNIKSYKLHGLIFDGGVFLANIFLVGYLPAVEDGTPEAIVVGFLALAIGAQIIGAIFKKGPLGRRIGLAGTGKRSGLARNAMAGLLFLHFLLFSVIAILVFAGGGLYQMQSSDTITGEEIWVVAGLAVGGVTTLAVWWAGKGDRGADRAGIQAHFESLELAGDLFLWISVAIVTQFFWGGLLALIEPMRGSGLSIPGAVLLLALSFLFVVFYLPSRYLYLVEDYHSPWTWAQMWVAMLPVAWIIVVG